MESNSSWPAVSQTISFTSSPTDSTYCRFSRKSTPIVFLYSSVNSPLYKSHESFLASFATLGKQSRNRVELAGTYLHNRFIILLLPTFPLPTTSTLISLCNRTLEDELLPLPAPGVVPVGAFTSKSSPCMLAGTCTYRCQPRPLTSAATQSTPASLPLVPQI